MNGCAQGAQPLFDRVDVDNGDAAALRHWQHHLGLLAGRGDLPDWETPAYEPWRLQVRTTQPGQPGRPCYLLTLAPPPGAAPAWQAGDIAEIGPRRERGGNCCRTANTRSPRCPPTARCNCWCARCAGPMATWAWAAAG